MASEKSIDLEPLTLRELEELAKRVVEEISRKRASGREWLQQHGTRVPETGAPRYQNPHNAAQTWSGRGKQPQWIEELLAQGETLESLLTDGAGRPRGGRGGEP
jgi:DNA-binding protein H-NS